MTFKKLIFSILISLFHTLAAIPVINKKLYVVSQLYIDVFRGYSYNFATNGEKWLLEKCAELLDDKLVVIFDVGANKGEWAKLAQSYISKAYVHCFELSPATFSLLTENFKGVSNAKLNNVGLSNEAGDVLFTDYGEGRGYNTLVDSPSFFLSRTTQKTKSLLTTGSIYMKENNINNIDFLKIDVEGWEYFVLKGFDEYLKPDVISLIQFEYGYASGDVHILMRDFYKLLEERGYCIGRLTPWGVSFSKFHHSFNDFKSGPNYVACAPAYVKKLKALSSKAYIT